MSSPDHINPTKNDTAGSTTETHSQSSNATMPVPELDVPSSGQTMMEQGDELIPSTVTLKEYLSSPSGFTDPYHEWTCAFGIEMPPKTLPDIPTTKKEFFKAVKDELQAIYFIGGGLTSYIEAIFSGKDHVFPPEFLEDQRQSSEICFAQLDKIKEHLSDAVAEVEREIAGDGEKGGDDAVNEGLRAIYAHARAWIERAREVVISSHVFFKINFALASDKKK